MFVVNIIKTITCVGVKMKTENKNISTFNSFYLVNPNNCVTHTHTQERDQYKGTRDARVIYNINTYKQRVCKKFFINFLHALFCGKNRAVCAQKLCIAVTQNNNNKFK